jgi:hypothetical protein
VLVPVRESSERISHPIFGCNSEDVIVDLSVYTKLTELIPKGVEEGGLLGRANPPPHLAKSAKPPLTNTKKYSSADQWLKSHGFVPPPSAAIAIESGQQTAADNWGIEWVMLLGDCLSDQIPIFKKEEDDWSSPDGTPPWNISAASSSSSQLAMPKFAKKLPSSYPPRALDNLIHGSFGDEKRSIQLIDASTNSPLTNVEQSLAELLKKKRQQSDAMDDSSGMMVLCLGMRYSNKRPDVEGNKLGGSFFQTMPGWE